MLDAVPNSSANILAAREIWSFGGMIKLIMEVPLPRAASRRFTSFFTFHISMFLSASFPVGADMMGERVGVLADQKR